MTQLVTKFNHQPKKRVFWAVLGSILILFGGLITISLFVKGGDYWYGLIFTGIAVVFGILLIAWVFGDE